MKNILTVTAILLCGGLQAQWYSVNSNTSENLHDVYFVDSLVGYCVGGGDQFGSPEGNGVVLETIDGGENWTTLFSQDSLSLQHVAVVNENNATKLYGFASKNGAPYLVSTLLSSQFQNWMVEETPYLAADVQVYEDVIYLKEAMDQTLKRFQNAIWATVLNDVEIFQVNANGIVFLNHAVDSVFVSTHDGENILFSKSLPPEMSQNQITNARIASFDDTLVVKATYPNLVTKSSSQGSEWNTYLDAPGFQSEIINSNKLFGMDNLNRIHVTLNAGESWQIQDSLGARINRLYFYNEFMGFAVGENGTIYKTTNVGGITSTREIEGLKKEIKIYPNPSNGLLSISIPQGLKINNIYLTDSNGRKTNTLSTDQTEINLSKFTQGVYFLTFETENGTQTEKIVLGK